MAKTKCSRLGKGEKSKTNSKSKIKSNHTHHNSTDTPDIPPGALHVSCSSPGGSAFRASIAYLVLFVYIRGL